MIRITLILFHFVLNLLIQGPLRGVGQGLSDPKYPGCISKTPNKALIKPLLRFFSTLASFGVQYIFSSQTSLFFTQDFKKVNWSFIELFVNKVCQSCLPGFSPLVFLRLHKIHVLLTPAFSQAFVPCNGLCTL